MFKKRNKFKEGNEEIPGEFRYPYAQAKNDFDRHLRMMTADHAELLPWASHFSVYSQIIQGLPEGDPGKAAAMLLGQAQFGVVKCVTNPQAQRLAITTIGQTLQDPLKTEALSLFEAIAAGSREIGSDEDGQKVLALKAMPAAIDGLEKFPNDPLELSRHVTIWFILALAGGTRSERLDLDQHLMMQRVFPPMIFE